MGTDAPLRVCRDCGLEAWTKEDLEKFKKCRGFPHGRMTWCIECANEAQRKYRSGIMRPKPTQLPYLRKCRICGLEVKTEDELNLFVKRKENKYGRRNLCKKCADARFSKGGVYYEKRQEYITEYKIKNIDRIREHRRNRFQFKGKKIQLGYNPRVNICPKCGRRYPDELEQQTCMHHEKYDDNDPLAYTREMCTFCHSKLPRKRRKHIKGKPSS